MAWNRDRNASYRTVTNGVRGTETVEIPGLLPGAYALTWSGEPEWLLAERTCNGALPTLEWTDLAPWGAGSLHFDSAELQVRRLETLTGR